MFCYSFSLYLQFFLLDTYLERLADWTTPLRYPDSVGDSQFVYTHDQFITSLRGIHGIRWPKTRIRKLNRKLVHISIGLAFMLFWPLFSSGPQAPFLAALAPGINIIRMLLMGLGMWKNEAMVKSMSRHGDYRELLKGPLYYACTITLATSVFWRTSPIGIAAICNLCAGDGLADIIGRGFGKNKLTYNPNKSIEGSIAMAFGGFIASIAYMHYFAKFGFMEASWAIGMRFVLVSVVAAFVESLPISLELDDNLTVPLASLLIGSLVF